MTSTELEIAAKKTAYILGEMSSSALALKELERQRELGREAYLELQGGTLLVISLAK